MCCGTVVCDGDARVKASKWWLLETEVCIDKNPNQSSYLIWHQCAHCQWLRYISELLLPMPHDLTFTWLLTQVSHYRTLFSSLINMDSALVGLSVLCDNNKTNESDMRNNVDTMTVSVSLIIMEVFFHCCWYEHAWLTVFMSVVCFVAVVFTSQPPTHYTTESFGDTLTGLQHTTHTTDLTAS